MHYKSPADNLQHMACRQNQKQLSAPAMSPEGTFQDQMAGSRDEIRESRSSLLTAAPLIPPFKTRKTGVRDIRGDVSSKPLITSSAVSS